MINHPLAELALETGKGVLFTPGNFDRLCKHFSPDLVRWALMQNELRDKATKKFENAKQMLFTREALEQASHEEVAKYHASLFPNDVKIADLCCGIGSDLMAFAKRGPVLGIDLDEERLNYAAYNLKSRNRQVQFIQTDSLQVQWDFEYAYADPARRVQGKRTIDLNEFSPSPFLLAEKMKSICLGMMKLSPMIPDQELLKIGTKIQFISYDRECREALVMMGKEIKDSSIEAVHLESGEKIKQGKECVVQDTPFKYLYEADPAAIRAGAIGELCYQLNLKVLGHSKGYLTSNDRINSPWLREFDIVWSGSYRELKIREAIKELNGEIESVKIRGVHLDPIKIKRKFKFKGQPLSLVIYSQNSKYLAILAKRILS